MAHSYTSAEIKNVKNWIVASLYKLIQEEGDLLKPESIPTLNQLQGQKVLNRELYETTINHRLACYLENLADNYGINGYHIDIEYNRYINNRKQVKSLGTGNFIEVRPDIVVHKRTLLNEPIPHFLVVEAKKRKLRDKDRNHIKDIMYDNNYQYKYGMLISYYNDPDVIQVNLLTLPNNQLEEHTFEVLK